MSAFNRNVITEADVERLNAATTAEELPATFDTRPPAGAVIRVLAVVRPLQIAMSVLGLAVYVFAVGGWFATTTWYEPWQSSVVLPIFVLLVAIIRLKPLPPAGA